MKTIKLYIEGISPLLMNNPAKMQSGNSGGGMKSASAKPDPVDEAEAGAYRDSDGVLYAPAVWFRSSFINGGKGRKIPGMKRGAATVAAGSLFLTRDKCRLINPDTGEEISEYAVDIQRAVVQRQGILRERPRIDQWATELELEYDEDFMPEEIILELGDVAGRTVGVGDYRPERKGPFGRFKVETVG